MLVVIVLYIHQMICTRNFKALNERIETGVLVKSQKRKNVSAVGSNWTVLKGDSCSFSHGRNRWQKAQSSSPAPKAKAQTDARKPREKVLLDEQATKVQKLPRRNLYESVM